MSDLFNGSSFADEISTKDVINFLFESWKLILALGFVGLFGALGLVWVTPSQYEAVARIKIAQLYAGNSTNLVGVNLEDSNNLVARFRMPSAYSSREIEACNLASAKAPGESMVGVAKVSTIKDSTSIIELKVRLESKELAAICAQAVYEGIRESQAKILEPYIDEARILLSRYQVRWQDAKSLMARVDESNPILSVAYLANRDELKFLSDEIIRLNAIITSGDFRYTKLLSPIYVFDAPVYPKNNLTIAVGFVGGLFLGLLAALFRTILFKSIKN